MTRLMIDSYIGGADGITPEVAAVRGGGPPRRPEPDRGLRRSSLAPVCECGHDLAAHRRGRRSLPPCRGCSGCRGWWVAVSERSAPDNGRRGATTGLPADTTGDSMAGSRRIDSLPEAPRHSSPCGFGCPSRTTASTIVARATIGDARE